MFTSQLKDIWNGVYFYDEIADWESATLPKNAALKAFPIVFAHISSFL